MKWYIYVSVLLVAVILAGVLAGPETFITLAKGANGAKEGFQSTSTSAPAQRTGLAVPTLLTDPPNNKKGILVHERMLYGYPGQTPIQVKETEKLIASVYNPFGYGMPQPSSSRKNTTRMYRLYVVYSDGMSTEGELKIHICNGSWGNCDKKLTFTASRTWGDTSAGPEAWHRDAFTDMKPHSEISQNHVKIYANTTVKDKTAVIRQITLQAFDVLL